jgi:hypothetical protein
MAEPHVVSALKDKRAEVSGAIADLERRIGQHRADLMHIDATLRLFAPEIDPGGIAPRKPVTRSAYFADGELARRCMNALRMAGGSPISAEQIAIQIMIAKGLDPEDRKTRSDFIRRVLWSLARLKGKGAAEKATDQGGRHRTTRSDAQAQGQRACGQPAGGGARAGTAVGPGRVKGAT